MRNTLRSLKQVMRSLLEEQRYQGTRDSVHLASTFAGMPQAFGVSSHALPRDAANTSTGRRAVLYAVLEAVSLVAISVAQVRLLVSGCTVRVLIRSCPARCCL